MKTLLAILATLVVGGNAEELSVVANAATHTSAKKQTTMPTTNFSRAEIDPSFPSYTQWLGTDWATAWHTKYRGGDNNYSGSSGVVESDKIYLSSIGIDPQTSMWKYTSWYKYKIQVNLRTNIYNHDSGNWDGEDETMCWLSFDTRDWQQIHYRESSGSYHWNHVEYFAKINMSWDYFTIQLKLDYQGHSDTSRYGYAGGSMRLQGNAHVVSDRQNKELNLWNNATKQYTFSSQTSSSLNSSLTHSLITGKDVSKSNANMIKDEMWKRITDTLGDDLNMWQQEIDGLNWNNIKIVDNGDETGSAVMEFKNSDGSRNLIPNKFMSKLTMPVKLNYDINGMKNTIKSWFSQTFEFSSDFSPLLNDEHSYSIQKEGAVSYKSNKEMIDDKVHQILKQHLASSDDQTVTKMMGNDAISYDNKNSLVKIIFAKKPNDNSDYITNNQWVSEVSMPVKIDLTHLYYERSVSDRLNVVSGYIIDPKSDNNNPDQKNKFVLDHPSYDDNTKTYTYHNSVSLSFASDTGMNEILSVNGKAVPVINNIFNIDLNDKRQITNDNASEEPTKYDIKVSTPDSKSDINFTIAIDSVANNVNYQWEGWHPSDDPTDSISYNQWLLTQPKINDNGKMVVNKKYNPLIDSSTGMISNTVFIKAANPNSLGKNPQKITNKYPFADDVLDDNNHLIRKYEVQKDKDGKTIYDSDGITPLRKPVMYGEFQDGYIAEAVVANSGVNNLTDNLENVDHIERVRLDPATLQEVGEVKTLTPDQLANEKQFSDEGLWHYIIYMKNHVDALLNPKKNADNPNTPATSGSTIHKLLYIQRSVADTGDDFLGLPFVQSNPNIQPFWTTSQAEHLKSYLVEKGFTSQGIKDASYENIVSYWYQYVSDVQNGFNIPAPHYYFQLDQLADPNKIKLNSPDSVELKSGIRKAVAEWLANNGGASLVAGTDYVITDNISNPQPLENADLSQMIDDYNDSSKKLGKKELYIAALSTSSLARGYKKINVLDSQFVNPNKMIDLSKVSLPNEIYNFSNVSVEDFKYKWINSNIHEALLSQRNTNDDRNIEYGKDYIIVLNDGSKDYKLDNTADDTIAKFLAVDAKTRPIAKLTLHIKALDDSAILNGETSQHFVNDAKAIPAPKWASDLNKIFAKTDLGELTDTNGNGYIDPEEVWARAIELNPNVKNDYPDLNINLLLFASHDNYNPKEWVVRANPAATQDFVGSVVFTYSSKVPANPEYNKIDINSIFLVKKLGEVEYKDNEFYDVIWKHLLAAQVPSLINDKTLILKQFYISNNDPYNIKPDKDGLYHHLVKIQVVDERIVNSLSGLNSSYEINPTYKGSITVEFTSHQQLPPDIPKPDSKPDDSRGLSKKAKIWIISASIGAAAVVGLVLAWWLRRRKTKKKMR